MMLWRYVGAEIGVEGGRIARGDPPAQEIHFTDWKSILRPANPTVLLQGGGGVCSY